MLRGQFPLHLIHVINGDRGSFFFYRLGIAVAIVLIVVVVVVVFFTTAATASTTAIFAGDAATFIYEKAGEATRPADAIFFLELNVPLLGGKYKGCEGDECVCVLGQIISLGRV